MYINLNNHPPGYLLLEDGACFPGDELTGIIPAFGEAVFNTSHSGYQEILTDPSYYRQILTFTCPHLGNVGINSGDMESPRIFAAGAVMRDLTSIPSNWRAQKSLPVWAEEQGIPLLSGVNTRGVALHLCSRGAMRAGIFPAEEPIEQALVLVKNSPSMEGADLASEVTCAKQYPFDNSALDTNWSPLLQTASSLSVAVIDFGVKRNILIELARRGCKVTVYPAPTPAETILANNHNGVLLSNGPGDPAAVGYAIETTKKLLGKIPLFGICLGHQILALAAGMQTFKLPFGHRGANHPAQRKLDGVIEITSQNHGFAVRNSSTQAGWRVTHINLNDDTVEGLEHKSLPVFSIQYHPEASPGPHDSLNYFDRFVREMQNA